MKHDENNRDVGEEAVDVSHAAEAVAAEGGEVTTREPDEELTEAGVSAEKPQRAQD
jgi:hypothetical protein